jgi:hypothetical protein
LLFAFLPLELFYDEKEDEDEDGSMRERLKMLDES